MPASAGERPASVGAPLASVVIPAHDEQSVLDRTLAALLRGTRPGELDVVVVANGCHDRTADIARRHGVRVLETAQAGKAHALRLGDASCTSFPRLYVDADIVIDPDSVRHLAAAVRDEGVLAASPVPRFLLDGAGPVARRVARVHDALMAPRRGLAGAGVYVLNEAGHERVFPLPDVLADDEWVHRMFAPHERAVVARAASLVRPPLTVRAHLVRRRRIRRGLRQLDALDHPAALGRLRLTALVGLVRRRRVTPVDAAVYLAVLLADRAMNRDDGGAVDEWVPDASSRQPA